MARAFRLTSPNPPPRPAPAPRAIAGKNAQRAGSNFQKAIEFSAGIHKGVVALESLPPFGAKRIGGGETIFLPICCDYVGALIDLCGLFFDAKSTDDDTSLNVKTFILTKEHQLHFLKRMCSAGQAAGYLVECKAMNRYLWLDVLYVTDDRPIRFARDGALCRQWLDLGSASLAVDFPKLHAHYVIPPAPAKAAP